MDPCHAPISRYRGSGIASIRLLMNRRYFLPDMPRILSTAGPILPSSASALSNAVSTSAEKPLIGETAMEVISSESGTVPCEIGWVCKATSVALIQEVVNRCQLLTTCFLYEAGSIAAALSPTVAPMLSIGRADRARPPRAQGSHPLVGTTKRMGDPPAEGAVQQLTENHSLSSFLCSPVTPHFCAYASIRSPWPHALQDQAADNRPARRFRGDKGVVEYFCL